jgi:hypothetical protein
MPATEPRARRPRRRTPHDDVYARIGRSRIHGVGVLAIRDIPRDTRLFRGEDERVVWVHVTRIRRLPVELRRLYTDFGMAWGQRIGVPRTLNMLSVGWYLNHSARPNTRCDEDGRFYALRRIRKGEELTADYRTFSDDDLTFRSMAGRRRKRVAASAPAGERGQRVATGARENRRRALRVDARNGAPRRARPRRVAERQLHGRQS